MAATPAAPPAAPAPTFDFNLSSINELLNQGNNAVITDERVAEIKNHFTSIRFRYGELIGRGGYGLAFSVRERVGVGVGGGRWRMLAVKRALRGENEGDLREEIKWMRRLSGSAPIARVIATRDDPAPPSRGARRFRQLVNRVRGKREGFLIGLKGPVLVVEYMENADLARLWTRLYQFDQLLPNRILWAFFLCFGDCADRWQRAWADGAWGYTRGKHHARRHGRLPRTHLVPVLKFIDFGKAKEDLGVETNALDICRVMLNMIARKVVVVGVARAVSTYKGYQTMATEILPQGNGARYPTLDDDLRDFLARCLAERPADRPSLAEMLATAEAAVSNKDAAPFAPNEALETDEAIRALLKRLVYDADTGVSLTAALGGGPPS
ncbi:Uu.00g143270.m01.CDS01 [Anthostomella pinea]|uniref:Uu.00g143270.m01.CDS01 n=1 Tax=Anthostomella pinea TaxID=933095 RepID=A0AAI8YJ92_9PEZI|nr:Uu.00g143270.m01.CDS01 [Anthostomella pinea]